VEPERGTDGEARRGKQPNKCPWAVHGSTRCKFFFWDGRRAAHRRGEGRGAQRISFFFGICYFVTEDFSILPPDT
jgi:hypothetical protein